MAMQTVKPAQPTEAELVNIIAKVEEVKSLLDKAGYTYLVITSRDLKKGLETSASFGGSPKLIVQSMISVAEESEEFGKIIAVSALAMAEGIKPNITAIQRTPAVPTTKKPAK